MAHSTLLSKLSLLHSIIVSRVGILLDSFIITPTYAHRNMHMRIYRTSADDDDEDDDILNPFEYSHKSQAQDQRFEELYSNYLDLDS